jgi:hypothetical protein
MKDRPRVAIRVIGGLGNMYFQLAMGETWRGMGYDVCYTNTHNNFVFITENCTTKVPPIKYKYIFKNFNWDARKKEEGEQFTVHKLPFRYTEITPEDGVEYYGFFQCEKYFPNREFIKWLFEPSDEIKAKTLKYGDLFKGITCSVHVRRGDYLRQPTKHPAQSIEYYIEALEVLMPYDIDRFLIFSDDLEWCRKNFTGNRMTFIDDIDYVELYLQAQCTHHIIANSSFSWWGAFLNETAETVVVAPKRWFGQDFPADYADDICPKRWTLI